MGLPLVKWFDPGEIQLPFARGPVDFMCAHEGRVHDNVAAGGLRERVIEHLDMIVTFTLPAMLVGSDFESWGDFAAFALAGGQFVFAPNQAVDYWFRCVSEDRVWAPQRVGLRRYSAAFRWRVVEDEVVPDKPSDVMRAFWGIVTP